MVPILLIIFLSRKKILSTICNNVLTRYGMWHVVDFYLPILEFKISTLLRHETFPICCIQCVSTTITFLVCLLSIKPGSYMAFFCM